MANKFEKLHIRVSVETAALLQTMANKEGLSRYVYAGDLLERAVIYEEEGVSDQLLAPHTRSAVRQELDQMMENLMDILLRNYMEAGTARRLIQSSLILPPEMERDQVLDLQQRNWDSTAKDLREDIKGFRDWRKLLLSDGLVTQHQTGEV